MGPVKWLSFFLFLVTVNGNWDWEQRQSRTEEDNVDDYRELFLGRSSTKFAINIYKKLSKNSGDIVVSPSSLQTILALIQMGAKGQTMTEIAKTLELPTNKLLVQNAFKRTADLLRKLKHTKFDSANKIYVQEGLEIASNFSELAKGSFNADIEIKDFKNSGAAQDINSWVENQTHGKIKDLVEQSQFNALTRMVLINAVYFGGEWESKFEPELTKPKHFYVNSSYAKTIDMMTTELICLFNDDNDLDAKFLELPYSGNEFSITFVLPNKRDGLEALEEKLDVVLEERQLDMQDVIVSIPKFSINQSVDFKEVLQMLGMVELFQEHADLSEMTADANELYVSQIIQKSKLELSEKGTEAASATAAFVIDRIFGGNAFYAGHPFLFILRESTTKTVEFIGRFTGL